MSAVDPPLRLIEAPIEAGQAPDRCWLPLLSFRPDGEQDWIVEAVAIIAAGQDGTRLLSLDPDRQAALPDRIPPISEPRLARLEASELRALAAATLVLEQDPDGQRARRFRVRWRPGLAPQRAGELEDRRISPVL